MATKHHTKADKAWFEAITGIGCVACLVQGTREPRLRCITSVTARAGGSGQTTR